MAKAPGVLSPNPIVEALHPDPDGERRVALVGFAGPSNAEGKVRLYADLSFRTYYEFQADAVLSTMPAKANDPNSPTVVVLDPKTQVDKVTVDRTSGDADYLSGEISGNYYGSAQPMGGGAAGGAGDCVCIAFSAIGNTLQGGAPQCACVLASIVGNTLAGPQAPQCVCILASAIGNTLQGGGPQAPQCVCILASAIGNTLQHGGPQAPQCVCILASAIGNTLQGGGPQAPQCACVVASILGNTLAGGAQAPNCCNPTYTAGNCTRQGPTMMPPNPADCICVFASAVGNTITGVGAQGVGCCHPTYSAAGCTQQGPTMMPPADQVQCLNITATTLCTPTGVPYVCPAG